MVSEDFQQIKLIAERLFEEAYRRGQWSAVFELGETAEARGDVRLAFRYHMILFLSADWTDERNARTLKGWTPNAPGFSHIAYAKIYSLTRSGKIPEHEILELQENAKEEAISRGFIRDCRAKSALECANISDSLQRTDCRVEIEDRCYRE